MSKYVDDALGVAGVGLVSGGAFMIYPAAGAIVLGALLLAAALLRGRARAAARGDA